MKQKSCISATSNHFEQVNPLNQKKNFLKRHCDNDDDSRF